MPYPLTKQDEQFVLDAWLAGHAVAFTDKEATEIAYHLYMHLETRFCERLAYHGIAYRDDDRPH